MQCSRKANVRILLVDDQPDYRKTIAVTLRYLGCSVVEYGGAGEALAATQHTAPPDLIVTDIDLGMGPNGFAFAEAARRQWPDLPVLFISGLPEALPPGGAGGRSVMLQKPFKLAELTKAMGSLIATVPPPTRAVA